METQSDYLLDRVRRDTDDSAYRESEKLRALRRVGQIVSTRLDRLARRGLGRFGKMLVSLGQWLEQTGAGATWTPHSPASLGNEQ